MGEIPWTSIAQWVSSFLTAHKHIKGYFRPLPTMHTWASLAITWRKFFKQFCNPVDSHEEKHPQDEQPQTLVKYRRCLLGPDFICLARCTCKFIVPLPLWHYWCMSLWRRPWALVSPSVRPSICLMKTVLIRQTDRETDRRTNVVQWTMRRHEEATGDKSVKSILFTNGVDFMVANTETIRDWCGGWVSEWVVS